MCKVRPWDGLLLMLLVLSSHKHWSTTCWLLSCFRWVRQPASQKVVKQHRGSCSKVSRYLFLSLCTPAVDELEVSALGLCLGLRGGSGLVFEWGVFGRGEAKLFWHLLTGVGLLVEAQLAQQLIDLGAGHVWQGNPLKRLLLNEKCDSLLSNVWNKSAWVIWIIRSIFASILAVKPK